MTIDYKKKYMKYKLKYIKAKKMQRGGGIEQNVEDIEQSGEDILYDLFDSIKYVREAKSSFEKMLTNGDISGEDLKKIVNEDVKQKLQELVHFRLEQLQNILKKYERYFRDLLWLGVIKKTNMVDIFSSIEGFEERDNDKSTLISNMISNLKDNDKSTLISNMISNLKDYPTHIEELFDALPLVEGFKYSTEQLWEFFEAAVKDKDIKLRKLTRKKDGSDAPLV